MATSALVAIALPTGSFRSIYVHSDGDMHPCGVGPTLATHYADPTDDAKRQALFTLGDLSSLGAEIGEKHHFNDRTTPNWCMAYGRDRGERGVVAKYHATWESLVDRAVNHDHFYLWMDGMWLQTRGGYRFKMDYLRILGDAIGVAG